jgi:hypothetical protein
VTTSTKLSKWERERGLEILNQVALERRDLVVPTKQVAPGNKFLEEGGISQPQVRPTLHLGVKANVQLKSSIPVAGKVEISPKGFTLGVKAEYRNVFRSAPSYY